MKFRYLILDEWGTVSGTNDREVAEKAFEDGGVAIDVQAGEYFVEGDSTIETAKIEDIAKEP